MINKRFFDFLEINISVLQATYLNAFKREPSQTEELLY